jgi:tetratricopeptide (TPR) repeat protein
MDQRCRDQLEFANKLIFVKQYEEADRVLRDILLSKQGAEESLVHLRRIELMSLMGRVHELKAHYTELAHSSDDDGMAQTCLILSGMFSDPASASEAMNELHSIAQQYGPSPLLFFAMAFGAEQQGNNERAKYNYEQSLALDPQWYPSLFGLSQVHFNMGDEAHGDQYFHQFELMAPYNLYGNFETHRRLSQEFTELGRYDEAERAIQALTMWWYDNRRYVPSHIEIFERLSTARISDLRGDHAQALKRRNEARALTDDLLNQSTVEEDALYFVARVLTEYGEEAAAFQAYKQVLKVAGNNPSVVQKVGSHFLGSGEFEAAKELFEHAYKQHPDNSEIRFCLLVARLKSAGVSVEEYLIGRERIRQLADVGDKVEFLSLLNALLSRFSGDWDVHFHLAELFLRMGHEKKAGQHYAKMYELDPLGQNSRLRYSNFLMNANEPDKAMDILLLIDTPKGAMSDVDAEVQWLKSSYYERKGEWKSSMEMLTPLLVRDPWNITYLIHEILCQTGLLEGANAVQAAHDHWAKKLASNDETRVNWSEFANDTLRISKEHSYQLAYARAKLQFLYMRGSEQSLRSVVREACQYDAGKGARELLRLVNTNFDHPSVYWGLGLLYKELWQLEVASMWFELTLGLTNLDDRLKSLVYLDLADSYIWRNINLPKSVEYIKLSLELSARNGQQDRRALMIMGHALLRQGQVRQAQAYLDQMRDLSSEFEVQYLNGLVQYRNGQQLRANEIWKPLLKFKTEQMREYRIKQEILRYYFEKTPYTPRDLSKAN